MIYTLNELIQYMKISTGSADYLPKEPTLKSVVSESIDYIESYCERKFTSSSYVSGDNERYYNGNESFTYNTELRLDNKNINSVDVLEYYNGQEWVDLVDDVDTDIIINNRMNSIILMGGFTFPTDSPIYIEYNSGYTSTNLPKDLKTVLNEMSALNVANSKYGDSRLGIKANNISVGSSTGVSYQDEYSKWNTTLDKYKLVGL